MAGVPAAKDSSVLLVRRQCAQTKNRVIAVLTIIIGFDIYQMKYLFFPPLGKMCFTVGFLFFLFYLVRFRMVVYTLNETSVCF